MQPLAPTAQARRRPTERNFHHVPHISSGFRSRPGLCNIRAGKSGHTLYPVTMARCRSIRQESRKFRHRQPGSGQGFDPGNNHQHPVHKTGPLKRLGYDIGLRSPRRCPFPGAGWAGGSARKRAASPPARCLKNPSVPRLRPCAARQKPPAPDGYPPPWQALQIQQ